MCCILLDLMSRLPCVDCHYINCSGFHFSQPRFGFIFNVPAYRDRGIVTLENCTTFNLEELPK